MSQTANVNMADNKTLTNFIESLAPEHWWKMDTDTAHSGSGSSDSTATDLFRGGNSSGGTVTAEQPGPSSESESFDFDTSTTQKLGRDFLTGGASGVFDSGTIMAIFGTWGNRHDDDKTILCFHETSGFSNAVAFVNGQFGLPNKELSLVVTDAVNGANSTIYRTGVVLVSDTWYSMIATCDGTNTPIVYVQGVARSLTEVDSGTPPATGAWLGTIGGGDGIKRIAVGDWDYGAAASVSLSALFHSHIAIWDRVLTAGEAASIHAGIAQVSPL